MKRHRRQQRPRSVERRPAREGAATRSLRERWMPSRINRKRWTSVAGCGGAGVVGCIALAQFTPPHDRNLPLIALAGLVIGAVAAPELEPKLFPAPAFWQAAFGAAGGGLLALGAGAGAGVVFAAVTTGAILGALARYWLKYV